MSEANQVQKTFTRRYEILNRKGEVIQTFNRQLDFLREIHSFDLNTGNSRYTVRGSKTEQNDGIITGEFTNGKQFRAVLQTPRAAKVLIRRINGPFGSEAYRRR